jgi:hypothetical protein
MILKALTAFIEGTRAQILSAGFKNIEEPYSERNHAELGGEARESRAGHPH